MKRPNDPFFDWPLIFATAVIFFILALVKLSEGNTGACVFFCSIALIEALACKYLF